MAATPPLPHFQRYLVTGVLTVIPLLVTWIIFKFIFDRLSAVGAPWIRAITKGLLSESHWLVQLLTHPLFHDILAALITLFGLYLLGWIATRMIGQRAFYLLEMVVNRLPFIKTVYGASKKLIATFQHEPGKMAQRVVLIPFPTPEMKTVGLLMNILQDVETGEKLAAVYVPTTPNPTSGYLEIVPFSKVIYTDWALDEAMTFVVSGGAIAPTQIHYSKGVTPPPSYFEPSTTKPDQASAAEKDR